MTFARRLSAGATFAVTNRRERTLRDLPLVNAQDRYPEALIVDLNKLDLTEVYPEDEEIPTIDEVVETSPCPFDPLGHVMLRGRCLRCGGAD